MDTIISEALKYRVVQEHKYYYVQGLYKFIVLDRDTIYKRLCNILLPGVYEKVEEQWKYIDEHYYPIVSSSAHSIHCLSKVRAVFWDISEAEKFIEEIKTKFVVVKEIGI